MSCTIRACEMALQWCWDKMQCYMLKYDFLCFDTLINGITIKIEIQCIDFQTTYIEVHSQSINWILEIHLHTIHAKPKGD